MGSSDEITPGSAEEQLRAMGVVSPKVPGANTLPDGRTVVVAPRELVTLHEVSTKCLDILASPSFLQAIEAARTSTREVIRDKSSAAVNRLKKELAALSEQKLVECDAQTSSELDAALAQIQAWDAAKAALVTATSEATRAQKALDTAEKAATSAREEANKANETLARAQQEATADDETRGQAVSKLLPGLYRGLKRWEALARA